MDSDLESRAPSPSSDIALSSNNIDTFLEDITVDIADENESSLMSENKLKRSNSISSMQSRKRGRSSAQENAADTAAKGMEKLADSIGAPQQTRFDQCIKILNDMKDSEAITAKDFFKVSRAFLKESEQYWALFFGMSEDLRLEWLTEENLLDINY